MRFELKAYCVSTVFTSSTTFGGPPSPKGKVGERENEYTVKLQFEFFPLSIFHSKREPHRDSLVGIDMNQETSEMERISMASPDRAAVKKSKRMTLS